VASDSHPRRIWPYVLGIGLGVLAGLVLVIFLRTRNINERTRAWVVAELQERFDSEADLESLQVRIFPLMGVTGTGLTLRYHNRTDLPPMFRIERFSFNLGFLGILHAPRHISGIHVENMTITIPPRGERKNQPAANQSEKLHSVPSVIVDEIVCDDTDLVIVPKKEGKDPLDFDIHDLVLKSVGKDKPFDFRGNLTNAKPKGEIATSGTFGPWDSDEPGDTPISGGYKFRDADLGPFPGIAGILSSTGKYQGQLNEIEVTGVTDTPDFSLDPVGNPVPLHTEYSATVNGTDGDTYLHPVRATLGYSLIIATGSVVRVPAQKGHMITLDVTSDNARMEDILRLATKSNKPFMTGVLNLKTKFLLPPGPIKVLDKLKLDGNFAVTDGRWASAELRDKLQSFSRHAEGQPENEDAGSAVSDMRSHFHLEGAVITFKDLTFTVPGVGVQLQGDYKMHGEGLDFIGDLRLRAKLSQTVTGKKSFFLKAIDPFFEKKGAGTLIPITISGTRDSPTVGTSIFHKKITKTLGKDQSKPGDQPSQEKQ
jgi:hypothetical protein